MKKEITIGSCIDWKIIEFSREGRGKKKKTKMKVDRSAEIP